MSAIDLTTLQAQLAQAGLRVRLTERNHNHIRVWLWVETRAFGKINAVAKQHNLYAYQYCGWSEGKYFLTFVPLKEKSHGIP